MRSARGLAASLVLSVSAFLFGLSYAQATLPGDVFQIVRGTHAKATPISDLPLGKNAGPSADSSAFAHKLLTILPVPSGLDPRLRPVVAAASATTLHEGHCAGAPGCRGPPIL